MADFFQKTNLTGSAFHGHMNTSTTYNEQKGIRKADTDSIAVPHPYLSGRSAAGFRSYKRPPGISNKEEIELKLIATLKKILTSILLSESLNEERRRRR